MRIESNFLKDNVIQFSDEQTNELYNTLCLDEVTLDDFIGIFNELARGIVRDSVDSEINANHAILAFDVCEAFNQLFADWGLYDLYANVARIYRPSPLDNEFTWESDNAAMIYEFMNRKLQEHVYGK